jgi:hypothetical protein
MSKIETRFEAGDNAERIHVAFFGFLESFADGADIDGDTHISIKLDHQERRVCARLWSAQAMEACIKRLSNDTLPAESAFRG